MSEAANTSTETQPTSAQPLVRHVAREEWGRALLLWERENKRAYQFEDGEMRVFAEGFYGLLQPAMRPDPGLRHRLREQALAHGHIDGAAKKKRSAADKLPAGPMPTIEDQITVFETVFPDGLFGDAWVDGMRARPDGRRRKNHRDPAIAEAAERLSQDALRALVEAGRFGAVVDTMLDVVGNTDLSTKPQLDMFRGLDVDVALAEALIGFLHDVRHGDLATMARLRRALARHGRRKLAWPGLTAARALLYPQDHMCVRPSVIRAQAKLTAPHFKLGSTPSAEDYARSLEIVMGVQEELTRAGFRPRDLFDVTEFMRVTLANNVKKTLVDAMAARLEPDS